MWFLNMKKNQKISYRFELIADMIESGNIDEAKLHEIEDIDNCFADIDYRVYLPIEEGVIPQQAKKLQPLYKKTK